MSKICGWKYLPILKLSHLSRKFWAHGQIFNTLGYFEKIANTWTSILGAIYQNFDKQCFLEGLSKTYYMGIFIVQDDWEIQNITSLPLSNVKKYRKT